MQEDVSTWNRTSFLSKRRRKEDQIEAAIYNTEMELLPQGIKDKLNILTQIQSRTETMEKEEAKIREDIHKMMVKSKVEHGILSKRLVEIDQLDKTLVELEQDLLTLRKNGRKAPDRRTRFAEPETPPRDIIETVVRELGIRSSHLSTTYKAARPTH